MKGSYVVGLLLIAIIAATTQHVHKSGGQGERIEKLAAGLKDVEKCLPLNAGFTFVIPKETLGNGEYMLWRYFLAPRYCSIAPSEKFDTVLTICVDANDSVLRSIILGRRLICSSDDGQYKYYLTCSDK